MPRLHLYTVLRSSGINNVAAVNTTTNENRMTERTHPGLVKEGKRPPSVRRRPGAASAR
jgi:hypothetical protein